MNENANSLPKTLPGAVCAQWKKCGKSGCRCAHGHLHGPYFFRFWREGGRLKNNANALATLAGAVWVKFKDPVQRIYSHPKFIYLGREYGNSMGLEGLLGGIDDIRFADPQYLDLDADRVAADQCDAKTISEWASFFRKLGMEDFIREPDFRQVVATGDIDRVGLALLLMDDHWDRSAPLLLKQTTSVNRRGYSVPGGPVPSEFCTWLSDQQWIPTANDTLAKPGLVFLDTLAIRTLLGDSVDYLGIPLDCPQLIAVLGIHTEPTVPAALRCLQQLASARSTDKGQFERLCQFLDQQFLGNEQAIRTAFRQAPLVYLPGSSAPYRVTAELFWSDRSRVFGARYGYVEKAYPKLRQFFLERLQIAISAGPSHYAELLVELSQKSALSSREEWGVQKCYEELETYLKSVDHCQGAPSQAWWTALRENAVCWTERREFHRPQKNVFLNDSDDLHALFRDYDALQFVKLPRNHHPRYRNLFQMLGVRRLSESVTLSFDGHEHFRVHPELTDLVRRFAGCVARYLYRHDHERYVKLKNNKTLERLSAIEVRVVAALEATYSLEGISVSDRRKAFADDHLYVQDDATPDADVLGLELARVWGKPKGLEDFLVTLFEKRTEERIERFLSAKDVGVIPEDESDQLSEPSKPGVMSEGAASATNKAGPAPFPALSAGTPPGTAVETPSSHAPAQDRVTAGSQVTGQTSKGPTDALGTRTGEVTAGDEGVPHAPNEPSSCDDRQSSSSMGKGDKTGASTGAQTSGRDGSRMVQGGGGPPPSNSAHERKGKTQAAAENAAKRQKKRKRKSGTARKDRVVTYVGYGTVEPKSPEESELASQESQFRINLGKAAVETVCRFEREHEREPTVLGQTHAGYDIVSTECYGQKRRKIEVKAINGEWSDRGVALTRTQFETACKLGDEFWLYVVENANDPDPTKRRVYPIQNPASRITEYRFDMGWRLLAESDESQ